MAGRRSSPNHPSMMHLTRQRTEGQGHQVERTPAHPPAEHATISIGSYMMIRCLLPLLLPHGPVDTCRLQSSIQAEESTSDAPYRSRNFLPIPSDRPGPGMHGPYSVDETGPGDKHVAETDVLLLTTTAGQASFLSFHGFLFPTTYAGHYGDRGGSAM